MGKTYVRVDDRLIHGQTIVAWCPTLNIKQIIAIDDVSAANPMLKSILAMSVPKIYDTHIVTTEEALALLERALQREPPGHRKVSGAPYGAERSADRMRTHFPRKYGQTPRYRSSDDRRYRYFLSERAGCLKPEHIKSGRIFPSPSSSSPLLLKQTGMLL